MKQTYQTWFIAGLVLLAPLWSRAGTAAPPQAETKEARGARIVWWREARFGVFVVFGPYSGVAGTWERKPVATNGCMEWIQKMVKADQVASVICLETAVQVANIASHK